MISRTTHTHKTDGHREIAREFPGGTLEVVDRADEPGRLIHAVRSWPEVTGQIARIDQPTAAWFLGNSWYVGRPSASEGYTLITGELPRNIYVGVALLKDNTDERVRLRQMLPTGVVPQSTQFTTESDEAGARAFAATSLHRERALHTRYDTATSVPATRREASPQRSQQTARLLQDLDRVLVQITEDVLELHRQRADATAENADELNAQIRHVEDTRRAVQDAQEALRSQNPDVRREGKNAALTVMYNIAITERVPRRQQRNEAAEAAQAEAARARAEAEELRREIDAVDRLRREAERARREAEARAPRPPMSVDVIRHALATGNVQTELPIDEEAARMHAEQVERARQQAQHLVAGYHQIVPVPAPAPPPNTARAWAPTRIPTHPIAAARGPDPCDRRRFPLGLLVIARPPYVNALWLDWDAWDNQSQGRITPVWHHHDPSGGWHWFYGPAFTIEQLRSGMEPPADIMKTVHGMFDPTSPDMLRVFPYFGEETLGGLWAYQTLPRAVVPYDVTRDPNRPFVVQRVSDLTFAVNAELRARRPPEPSDIPYPLR